MRLKRATYGDMRPGGVPRLTSFVSPKSLRLYGGELVRRFAPAEKKASRKYLRYPSHLLQTLGAVRRVALSVKGGTRLRNLM